MTSPTLTVVPANRATRGDLEAIFGTRGVPAHCQCQWFKSQGKEWNTSVVPVEERAARLYAQTGCGNPDSESTSGLVAYVDGEPAGWCAVEPRNAYERLGRVPWSGRDEDRDDETVWAVTCFVVRVGYRRKGLMYELARAAVDFARDRGAKAVEGYPMMLDPGQEATWGELFVGTPQAFAAAGMEEVSHPTKRRLVMRIDFTG